MNWQEWIKKLAVQVAVLGVLLGIGVHLWNRERRLRVDAERAGEAAQLALHDLSVEAQKSRGDLERDKKDLIDQNALLREAYEKAVSAAPDAKVVSASRLDTGSIIIQKNQQVYIPAGSPPSERPCAVRDGDAVHIHIKVDILELQTKLTNTIIVGTAGVYLVGPPEALLAEGVFKSSLTRASELAVPAPPRWGAALLGACGVQGCGPGLAVLLPPATVFGARLEGLLGVTALPGALHAMGGLGIRW